MFKRQFTPSVNLRVVPCVQLKLSEGWFCTLTEILLIFITLMNSNRLSAMRTRYTLSVNRKTEIVDPVPFLTSSGRKLANNQLKLKSQMLNMLRLQIPKFYQSFSSFINHFETNREKKISPDGRHSVCYYVNTISKKLQVFLNLVVLKHKH